MSLRDFLFSVSGWRRVSEGNPPNGRNVEPPNGAAPGFRRRAPGRRLSDARPVPVPRVLLVEPHDDTRFLYAMLMEDVGAAVYAVSNGSAAIEVARHRLPDVVVMEMAVPDGDGFAILQALRSESWTADIPAVVVTSVLHFNVPARARQSGATIVLTKPLVPDILLGAVEDLLMTTPPERLARRQLRRSLLTLTKLGAKLGEPAKERVRGLIDRLQIAVLAIDDTGHYVAASSGAEQLTGFRREELLGMSVFDAALGPNLPFAAPWDAFRASAADRDTLQATIRDRTGRPVRVSASFVTVVPGLDVAAFARDSGEVAMPGALLGRTE